MKKITILLLTFFLISCSCKPIYMPVYTVPEFDIPARPVLRSTFVEGSVDTLSKNVELDLVDLATYSSELENILKTIKFYKINSEVVKKENNK